VEKAEYFFFAWLQKGAIMTQREFMLKTTMECNDEGTHCYSITREFVGKEGGCAILLTLYPSYSANNDSFRLDSTAFHFLGHMEELGLSKVVFVNLFSKIVKGTKLSCRHLVEDKDNFEYLKKLAKAKEYKDVPVIVAYGSSMKTSKVAQESKRKILELFQESGHPLRQLVCEYADAKDATALHPLYLGTRCQNLHWSMREFDISCIEEDKAVAVPKQKTKGKKEGVRVR